MSTNAPARRARSGFAWALCVGLLVAALTACGPPPPPNEVVTIQELDDLGSVSFIRWNADNTLFRVSIRIPFEREAAASGFCPQLGPSTTARYLDLDLEVSHGGGFSRSISPGGFGAPYSTGCYDAGGFVDDITFEVAEARGDAPFIIEDETGRREIRVESEGPF